MTSKEDLRRLKNDQSSFALRCKHEVEDAQKQLANTRSQLADVERDRDAISAHKQSEERIRLQTQADIEVLRSQNSALALEKDLAVKENEVILDRLDHALGARRWVVFLWGSRAFILCGLIECLECNLPSS
jgi:hypothetical protein